MEYNMICSFFQLDEDIKLHFIKTLEKQYGVDTNKNPENNLITDAWDAMQRTVSPVTYMWWRHNPCHRN